MPEQLLCTAPGELAWQEYEDGEAPAGQFRIQCQFGSTKHGTEMARFKGYQCQRGSYDEKLQMFVGSSPRIGYPMPVGNMNVGLVTQVGAEVSDVAPGDRILAYGPFQQTLVVVAEQRDRMWWRVPEHVSWQAAVCIDPATYALAAIRDGQVRIGDAVAVFSMGAIGLMAVQCAKLAGAFPVIAVEPLANRRAAAAALGAELVLDPTSCDAGERIRQATGGRGVDVAIEYSGHHLALQHAIRGAAFGGTVVCGAYPPPYEAGLDLGAEAHFNRPTIVFSRACSDPGRDHPRWDEQRVKDACWSLICAGRLSGEQVVGPVVDYERAMSEYAKIATDPDQNIKLSVRY